MSIPKGKRVADEVGEERELLSDEIRNALTDEIALRAVPFATTHLPLFIFRRFPAGSARA